MPFAGTVDVSICMVSLNCWDVLRPCLQSLLAIDGDLSFEVIIVDNASTDGTPERLRQEFPWVRLIENDRNLGFTRATNQGIRASRGRLLLWLNTDTLLRPESLPRLVQFLDDHPRVGIVGPQVLNRDGSFQPQCRRGMPTPGAALAYMLGIARLRPDDPRFGQYLLSYRPVDEACEVTAVSGCCLAARREVCDDIGLLDEDIFGFGEDIDWCVRAANAGWQVWYCPSSIITHLKGFGGAHSKPYHKIFGIHQAMWVFFRKHLRPRYSPLVAATVYAGICASLAASTASTAARRSCERVSTWLAGQRPSAPVIPDPPRTTSL